MVKTFEESCRVEGARGAIEEREAGRWCDGYVSTPWGYVIVFSQYDATTYRFIHNRRMWYRSEARSRTARGIATEAARFASRIARSVDTHPLPET